MIVPLRELIAYFRVERRRTLVAILGIAMGATSLVLMDTISGAMKKKVETELGRLGALLVMVVPGEVRAVGQRRFQFSRYTSLKPKDVEYIRQKIPFVAGGSGIKKKALSVKNRLNESHLSVSGVETDYFRLLDYRLAQGRLLVKEDMKRMKKVVVIGSKIPGKFFKAGVSPIGKTLNLGSTPFTVIGVLEKRGSFSDEDFDETLFIPLTTEMRVIENVDFLDGAVFQAASRGVLAKAIEDIRALLVERHGKADFTINTYQEVQGTASKTLRLFSVLSRIVAFVAFCVGTLGILAVMSLSIYERLLEIAIKRVVGARKIDIFLQFLAESMVLSVVGSIAGVLFSMFIGLIVQLLAHWPFFIPLGTIGLSILLSAITGVVAGVYPAVKALEFEPRKILKIFEEQ